MPRKYRRHPHAPSSLLLQCRRRRAAKGNGSGGEEITKLRGVKCVGRHFCTLLGFQVMQQNAKSVKVKASESFPRGGRQQLTQDSPRCRLSSQARNRRSGVGRGGRSFFSSAFNATATQQSNTFVGGKSKEQSTVGPKPPYSPLPLLHLSMPRKRGTTENSLRQHSCTRRRRRQPTRKK